MCKVIQIVIRIFEEENGVQEDYQKMRIHICLLIIVFFICLLYEEMTTI